MFVIAALAMPDNFFTRLQEASSRTGAGAARVGIWVAGWEAVKHYGIVGAGLSNFHVVYDKYMGASTLFRGAERDPHNIYLEILVELGLVGLLLFALASVTQVREANASRVAAGPVAAELSKFLLACEVACFGMLACSFFLGVLWFKPFWLAWIFLAVLVRLMRSAKLGTQPAV